MISDVDTGINLLYVKIIVGQSDRSKFTDRFRVRVRMHVTTGGSATCWRHLANEIKLKWSARPRMRAFLVEWRNGESRSKAIGIKFRHISIFRAGSSFYFRFNFW